jgi:DNA polymerase-3 subunit gamma/tau
MHVALPRKWRPRRFADLVGQDTVSKTLTQAISGNRVAPAYLLTGPRGVGKTSTARLLARALNCDKGPTPEPCDVCVSCREIRERGDSLDVHEIDGASNRKIENARELIETIRYAPQRDRYRIAVIDEVHMLTAEAFNALLKTLEEPPPHARFILASTELHRIPATIVSRCQRFAFRALTAAEISGHLEKVAAAESIAITPGALRILAAAADGSLRDALSLLDQAATIATGTVDETQVSHILALVDRELLEAVYSGIASGDRASAVAALGRLAEKGSDPRHVFRELLDLLRTLLLIAAGGNPAVPEGELPRWQALARAMPYENLLRAISLAIEAEALARRTDDAALVLQLTVLRLAELPRLRRVEDLLSGSAAPAPAAPSRPEPASSGPRILSLVSVETEPAPPSAGGGETERALERFHEILDARKRVMAAHVSLAESLFVAGDELVMRFGIDKATAKEALEEPAARKLIADVAREAFGRPLRVVLRTGPPLDGDLGKAAREVAPATIARERASSRAETDPVVRSALELFRGELTEVKEEE